MRKGAISSSGAGTYGFLTRFYGSYAPSDRSSNVVMRKGAINLWLPYAFNATLAAPDRSRNA